MASHETPPQPDPKRENPASLAPVKTENPPATPPPPETTLAVDATKTPEEARTALDKVTEETTATGGPKKPETAPGTRTEHPPGVSEKKSDKKDGWWRRTSKGTGGIFARAARVAVFGLLTLFGIGAATKIGAEALDMKQGPIDLVTGGPDGGKGAKKKVDHGGGGSGGGHH